MTAELPREAQLVVEALSRIHGIPETTGRTFDIVIATICASLSALLLGVGKELPLGAWCPRNDADIWMQSARHSAPAPRHTRM